jgi:hypothetical protein
MTGMMKMSRYNYIPIFSMKRIGKKYSLHSEQETRALAIWDLHKKNITFFLRSWKWVFTNKPSYSLYRKLINTMTHETIHGVTQKILEQDKFSGGFDPEWPNTHGMDPDYERVVKRVNAMSMV